MPEVKKLWIVRDADVSVLDDPVLKDDAERLLQFCGALDEGGYSLDKFLRIYDGTGAQVWKSENTRVYDDAGSARGDAEKRLAKMKARREKIAARIMLRYRKDVAAAKRVSARFSG